MKQCKEFYDAKRGSAIIVIERPSDVLNYSTREFALAWWDRMTYKRKIEVLKDHCINERFKPEDMLDWEIEYLYKTPLI